MKSLNEISNKFLYRVKENESLADISSKFSSPQGVIIFENDLQEEVYAGQVIIVPVVKGTPYKVKPFDTLFGIAKENGVSVEELKEKNKTEEIVVGQIIFI